MRTDREVLIERSYRPKEKVYPSQKFENLSYLDKYLSKKILAKFENSLNLFNILEKYKYLYEVRIKQKVENIRSKK